MADELPAASTSTPPVDHALRASEIRYRRLFEAARDGILILDAVSGEITAVNPYLADLLGYSQSDILGKKLWEISPFEDTRKSKIAFKELQSEEYIRYDDLPLETRDGRSIDVEFVSNMYVSDTEKVIQCNIRDITQRKQTERARQTSDEALHRTEARMRFALQNADIGIWDMDYTSGVLRWSDVMEAQYGLPPGTFPGTLKAFVERIHPEDRASTLGIVEKAMKAGTDFTVLHRGVRPDGTVRWLSGAGRFFLDEQGQPLRAVGISQDVTERHALEVQFQQAQKMEAVGRLAGGVAHDFNNLLTAILGFCELLLAGIAPKDPHRPDIEEIQKAGTRAAELTRQLLAFSRKQIIEPTLLDLNAILAGLRPMLGRLIKENVRIVFGIAPNLALVNADRSQLEQVVLNLAVNAQDAMPDGGTLTIETANIDLDEHYAGIHLGVTPGRYVTLTVTDTGAGMSSGVQQHLFEPFFTTKEAGKGTGLGLASVHGSITRSGGSISVYSELGHGSVFTIYLPQATGADAVVDAVAEVAPTGTSVAGSGRETVLVVEDADSLRELTKRLLERHGYSVLVAASADEALRVFEANPSVDLLLTDVVMPGTSGPELTRQLIEHRPALKVVYMSGYTDEAIVQQGILAPGLAFLHKPFTSDALGWKIRQVLDAPAPS